MSSEIYPTVPVPNYPYDLKVIWNTTVSSADSGKEQRRQKNLYPKYDVSLKYSALSLANMQILWNYYQSKKGTYEPFYFYSLESTTWESCYIGIGNASSVLFDLPGRATSLVSIYRNGTQLSLSDDYVLLSGGGAATADRVQFVVAPVANDLITCNFTGYLRIRCKFQEELSRSGFTAALYETGIKLKGLSNI